MLPDVPQAAASTQPAGCRAHPRISAPIIIIIIIITTTTTAAAAAAAAGGLNLPTEAAYLSVHKLTVEGLLDQTGHVQPFRFLRFLHPVSLLIHTFILALLLFSLLLS